MAMLHNARSFVGGLRIQWGRHASTAAQGGTARAPASRGTKHRSFAALGPSKAPAKGRDGQQMVDNRPAELPWRPPPVDGRQMAPAPATDGAQTAENGGRFRYSALVVGSLFVGSSVVRSLPLRPCKYLIGRVRSQTASGLAAAADRQTHQVGDRCLYAANPRHLRIKPGTARFLLQTAPTEYRKRSAGRGSRPQRRVCTLYSRVTLRTLILLACTRPGRRGRVGLQFIDTLQCVASDYNTSFFYQSFW